MKNDQTKQQSFGLLSLNVAKQLFKLRGVLLMFCLFVPWILQAQQQKVTINVQKVDISIVFKEIKKQTGMNFVYNTEQLKSLSPVTLMAKEETVESILTKLFANSNFEYAFDKNSIIIREKKKIEPIGKIVEISGKVDDETGNSLPGVTVLLKGTSYGVATDLNGLFKIKLPEQKDNVLIFSFVGMEPREVYVKNNKPIQVTLLASKNEMDEVIVNGLFTQNKNSYTGAVQSIKGEELLQVSNTDVLKALVFLTPGMQMIENNEMGANPNAIPEIILRGTTALATEGQYGLNTPLIIMDGIEISLQQLYDIDMNDIETVDVLKDASAAAIYGNKAANGVIVVTRKKVIDSKMRVRYNFVPDIQFPDVSSFNLCNAEEKLELERLFGLYDSKSGEYDELYWKRKEIVNRGAFTDWKSIPLRNSWSLDHSLSITGRGGGMEYNVNLRYGDRRGVMKGDYRRRYGLGLNLAYILDNALRISYRMDISKTDSKDSPYGTYFAWVKRNPYELPKDEYGEWIKRFDRLDANPLYRSTLDNFKKTNDMNITNSISLRWDIIKGLYLNGGFNYTLSTTKKDDFVSPEDVEFTGEALDKKGRYSIDNTEYNNWSANGTLSYNIMLDTKGSLLSLNAGGSLSRNKSENYLFSGLGFLKPSLNHLGFAVRFPENEAPGGGESIATSVAVHTHLNFIFRDRIFIDGSYQSSASSSVASKYRWEPYYSLGFGWNVHNEYWLKETFIDRLRMRGSWGYTGSNQLSNFEAKTTYRYQMGNNFMTGVGANPVTMGNEELKASRTMNWNVGLEMGLFKERLEFTFDIYRKVTKDMMLPISYPSSVGVTSLRSNLGEQENQGFEWTVTGVLVDIKDLRWRVTLSGQHNEDKIKKISNSLKYLNESNKKELFGTGPKIQFEEGESSTSIFVVPSKGIDPASGKDIFVKKDGSLTFIYDPDDKVAMGNTIPKFSCGIGNSIYYKGFSVYAAMNLTIGGWIYNSTRADKIENINPKYNVDRRALTQRWHQPGDQVYYLGYDKQAISVHTQRFLEKRNEFTLQTVNLSYDFSAKFLTHIGLKRLRLGITFSEVFRASTVRYERGTGYPYMRSYNFVISPTF